MRPNPATVRLGDKEFVIRPLTLRQIREIEPILMQSGEAKGNIATAMAIFEIALSRDHAEAASGLGDIESTAPEIAAAMGSVLRLGGFIEAEPGESPAA